MARSRERAERAQFCARDERRYRQNGRRHRDPFRLPDRPFRPEGQAGRCSHFTVSGSGFTVYVLGAAVRLEFRVSGFGFWD
jgi:hypothetical protein